MTNYADLVKRLCMNVYDRRGMPQISLHVNPDGPEAAKAIIELQARLNDITSALMGSSHEVGRLRGTLNYIKIQAENGTLHPQVVIQNARAALERK